MKLTLKKECKHSVVYEEGKTTDVSPVRSVYVDKVWLISQSAGQQRGWPKEIELEVKVVS